MASFTPVASLTEVPQTNQGFNTLGSLMNLEQKQLSLQKQKELTPYEIDTGKATSRTATAQATSSEMDLASKKQNAIASRYVSMINNPLIIAAEQNPTAVDKAKLAESLKKWGLQQGEEAGVDAATAEKLTQPYVELALNNPSGLRNYLKERMITGLDTGAKPDAVGLTPQLTTNAAGQIIAITPQTGEVSVPGASSGAFGSPSGAPVQPGAQAQTGVTPQQMSQPAPSEFSKKSPLLYPTRQAGQPIVGALPSEEEDRKIGSMVRTNLIARQGEIPQSRRSVDEVIKKAQELEKEATLPTSGVLGSIERNFSTFLGTEQGIRYKELSKDLANAQIANIQASGGSLATDAGKQLARMANGDETYPPKVLVEIARRTQADMTGLDMKATAIQKFATKFGDNNIKAFEQDWSKNADPKIFQLKNIFDDPNLSPAEKAEARNKLIGKDEKQLKIFNEKWNNIKKLEQTGSL